nr:hypothetical protein [Phycisphaeraceae bacterium]
MTIPTHIQQAIQAYYAERATPEDIAALEDWFREDEAHIKVFAEHGMIEWQILCQQEKADATAILTMLREAEDSAEADTVTLLGEVDAPAAKVSAHDYAEAGRYLFGQAIEHKRAIYAACSAIAAVLLIALTLVFVFSGGQDDPVVDPLANTPLWDTPTPKHLPVVATLTDEVGAQWRSDDKPVPMSMGAQLVAFERYTLTHGFAEITTRRGAKALLQAPCTIELTDHDNAIRLHSGKLVGKC